MHWPTYIMTCIGGRAWATGGVPDSVYQQWQRGDFCSSVNQKKTKWLTLIMSIQIAWKGWIVVEALERPSESDLLSRLGWPRKIREGYLAALFGAVSACRWLCLSVRVPSGVSVDGGRLRSVVAWVCRIIYKKWEIGSWQTAGRRYITLRDT